MKKSKIEFWQNITKDRNFGVLHKIVRKTKKKNGLMKGIRIIAGNKTTEENEETWQTYSEEDGQEKKIAEILMESYANMERQLNTKIDNAVVQEQHETKYEENPRILCYNGMKLLI